MSHLVLLIALIVVHKEALNLRLVLSVLEAAIDFNSAAVTLVLALEFVDLADLDKDRTLDVT